MKGEKLQIAEFVVEETLLSTIFYYGIPHISERPTDPRWFLPKEIWMKFYCGYKNRSNFALRSSFCPLLYDSRHTKDHKVVVYMHSHTRMYIRSKKELNNLIIPPIHLREQNKERNVTILTTAVMHA